MDILELIQKSLEFFAVMFVFIFGFIFTCGAALAPFVWLFKKLEGKL